MDLQSIIGLIGKRDANPKLWDDRTRGGAPHKPFLVLALCDLFEAGLHDSPLIPGSGPVLVALAEHFSSYWNQIIRNRRGDMMMPFWALSTAGFWTMIPRPGVVRIADKQKTFSAFDKLYQGAELNSDVFAALMDAAGRNALRAIVIGTYFDQPTGEMVSSLVRYNEQTESFRKLLLDAARDTDGRARERINQYSAERNLQRPVRDQGFRIAVREAYSYRCASCGIRILTPDGHVLVQGAHIRAWSDNADDRIVNGLALCNTCHWGFDEGLWTVDARLTIRTSPVLNWGDNIAGYLGQLHERPLIKPSTDDYLPDQECLAWHRETKFRNAL